MNVNLPSGGIAFFWPWERGTRDSVSVGGGVWEVTTHPRKKEREGEWIPTSNWEEGIVRIGFGFGVRGSDSGFGFVEILSA